MSGMKPVGGIEARNGIHGLVAEMPRCMCMKVPVAGMPRYAMHFPQAEMLGK
jgi:hypothetical protein